MAQAMTSNGKEAQSGARKGRGWWQWLEPWYGAYGLQGATIAGLAPILLPLAVSAQGNAAHVGLVMAAFNLGGLMAPLWGRLADRHRLHRWLLVGGLVTTAGGLAAFPFAGNAVAWIALALLQGIGAAATATVANLFIVEAHPKPEWDERIGWLQTSYGIGQVVGLLVAGAVSQGDLRLGLLIGAGLSGLAALLAWVTADTPPKPTKPKPVLLSPSQIGEWAINSPQRLFHHVTAKAAHLIGEALRSPFGLFMLAWLLAFGGSAAIFSLYPVMMRRLFGINAGISSSVFAVAAGLGIALYSPAGVWSDRAGPMRVLRVGLGLRLLAVAGLLGLGLAQIGGAGWLALVAFALIVLSWSLLTVAGTDLAARLSPVSEGEAMGIFNAMTAAAGVAGSGIGGWAASAWGYAAAPAMALGGVTLGLLLTAAVRSGSGRKE
jgi:MFS family permease